MSKIPSRAIIRNIFNIICLAAIITAALSLGSASGTDGFIARVTGTPTAKAATAPKVTTNNASDITATAATLNGNLTSLGTAKSVNVSFEYGPTTSYGSTKAGIPPTRTSIGAFTANLTGLTPGQTYHFRAKAVGDGTVYGSDATFTTTSSKVTPPVVTTNAASGITATSATINGNLTSLGTATSVNVSFKYGETTDYGKTTTAQKMTSTGTFTANLPGLTSDKTYHFRAMAAGDGTVNGSDATFTTTSSKVTPPVVTTNAASGITATSATINGNLTSLGTATSVNVSFKYGETTDYGKTTTAQKMTSTGTFTANLPGLTSDKTYHFRAMAAGDGTVNGSDATFTTTSSKVTPPVVTTNAASGITATSATINGNLSDLGSADSVMVSFEYGTSTTYGFTVTGVPPTLDSAGAFTANLTGITSGQTYHFRAKSVGDGTVYGNDATFTTPLPASFTFTTFNITPLTSKVGDTLDISVTCANIGGSPGMYPVVLKINGVYEQREEVSLDPGESRLVTFAVTADKTGTYEANVNELISSFVIQKSPKSRWPIIAGIVGGTIVVVLIVLFIFRRSSTMFNNNKVLK